MLALYVQINRIAMQFRDDRKAVTAMEYGLIAALIAVAIIGAVTAVGGKLTTTFNAITAALPAG